MFRNWILQDLPHVLTPKSLQTIGTASFHTNPTRNRKFWNLFEFSRKNNRKDVKKPLKQGDSTKTAKNNKLTDSSKSMFAITNSNKVYSAEQTSSNEYTFRYIPRLRPRNKALRSNINKPDELTSLLDGNLVPTNMKLKLKGYKTLRNEQAKDFAFVPGGKCLELDILPSKNEDDSTNVTYTFAKPVASKKFEKFEELSPQEMSYNELETQYVPFPIPTSDYSTYTEYRDSINKTNTDDPTKIAKTEADQSQLNQLINIQKKSETKVMVGDDTLTKPKKDQQDSDQIQVLLGSEKKDYEKIVASDGNNSQVQQSQNDVKRDSQSMSQKNIQLSSSETVPTTSQSKEHSTKPSSKLSNQNQVELSPLTSLNQPSTQANVSETPDANKVGKFSSPYIFPNKRMDLCETSHEHLRDSSIKKMDKDNPGEATESEIKSGSKIPRYSVYESRMEQQRRASSPCSTSFVRARENSTKQRWSGFDRPATGCCPGSSGSHGTGSQGSTRPYPPTVPTREASSKCYARERDPIVRSDIARSRKMVKTRNSVTAASIATVNFAEVSTRVKGERVLLRSKSATGFTKTSQTVAYGSCNKSSSHCNQKNSCSKKRRGDCEDEEMIPGKVICTKPRRKNDCSRPKPCRVEKPSEKNFACAERPPPPRPSCCRPKKKKVCKRYCCPALQTDDCLLQRHTCPPKRSKKCSNSNEDDDEFDRPDNEDCYQRLTAPKDPTCLPIENDENGGPIREICTNPKRCNRSRSCNRDDRDDDCLETETEYREICTKPKKKECCNSKRSSRRSNSCGNRRYHSETRPLRRSKSFVTIPMFDVSVVSLRPYQNDAILRFYSCQSGWKPPSSCGQQEDPCKKKCQKPEPKCLNKNKNASACGEVNKDNCTRIIKQSMHGKQEDPCAKTKVDPCTKKSEIVCGEPKIDPCKSSKDTKEADRSRLEKELKEMQKCKSINKKSKTEKNRTGLERVVSPCKKNQKKMKDKCDKFESIDDLEVLNVNLGASRAKLDDPSIGFWMRRECDSSLLNFGMKPDNIIVNRSFCTTAKTNGRYENALQKSDNEELPLLVEAEPTETEWDEESSSSER